MKTLLFLIATLALITACNAEQSATSSIKDSDNSGAITLTTYKSATCGCCKLWVNHAREAGLDVTAVDVEDLAGVKQRHKIDAAHQSCHTSVSPDGFVFEGHIPAKLVRQFLQNPPQDARGLAVPAMPLGSPGMEVGDRFTPYQVWQLNNDGSHTLYAEVNSAAEQF